MEKVLHLMYELWMDYLWKQECASSSTASACMLCVAARLADELKRTRIVDPMRERLDVRRTYMGGVTLETGEARASPDF